MTARKATPKQKTYLLSLLKSHKTHPSMPQWWEALKPYWVVTEVAPGVAQGDFSDDLPIEVAHQMIEEIKTATSGAAKPKFDAAKWVRRVGTYWVDPATSNVVWVRVAHKTGRPYGMVRVPGGKEYLFEHGLLRESLVPLTKEEFTRVATMVAGEPRCPICSAPIKDEDGKRLEDHLAHCGSGLQ